MKERQRWRAEEDALLRAYVRQYGPREWHLVSQRMNTPLDRDAKSCLERWKNYLKPGIKKGSLTEEEQDLVIRLQAKHGNKWKKIAAEVPGRTAKRLGKWWEVFKEKQQRESKEKSSKVLLDSSEDTSKYDRILETFAEKLVKDRSSSSSCCTTPQQVPIFMGGSNNGGTGFIHPDPQTLIPPWLSNSSAISPNAPSVTLSLSPSTAPPAPPPAPPILHWLQPERVVPDNNNNNSTSSSHSNPMVFPNLPAHGAGGAVSNIFISELAECCRELEEGQRAWAAHKKEAAWRLRRLELQLESEKACKRKEKMDEIEAKIQSLREEQKLTLERIEAEYKEQLAGLRWDAEAKEQKLAEQWLAKHNRLTKFLEQMGCRSRPADPNAR